MRLRQAGLKRPRSPRGLRRSAHNGKKAAVVAQHVRSDGAHLSGSHKTLCIVARQKTEKLTGQDQRGNRLLIKPGSGARQTLLLGEFHVWRVVAQAGKAVLAQLRPAEVRGRLAVQVMGLTTIQRHGLVKEWGVFQQV